MLGGLAALFLVATLPLTLLSGQLGEGLVALGIGIPCAGVGVVVARRQRGNPLGWLFLGIALCLLVANDGGDYSYFVYRLGHHLPFGPAALALEQLWIPGLVLIVVVILLFPDGRLTSRFWRWGLRAFSAVYIALLAALAAALAGALGAHPLRIDATGGLVVMDNPAGWFAIAEHSILVVSLILSLGFIFRQLLSWRRSSGERRGFRGFSPDPIR